LDEGEGEGVVGVMVSESHTPVSLVVVWFSVPLFVQVTVSPGAIVRVGG
jgi:hypothetical protein